MKKIHTLLLLLSISFSHAQHQEIINENYMNKREKPSLFNGFLKTMTLKDSVSDVPYLSSIESFNKKGRSFFTYQFNRKGDTVVKDKTFFPKDLLEIEITYERGLKNDTAITFYNKKDFITKEIWKWGEEKEIDTIHFVYDLDEKLIAERNIYGWGKVTDSLIYENNKLKTILKIDHEFPKYRDSVSYVYNAKGFLIQETEYNDEKKISSSTTYEHNTQGKVKKEIFKSFLNKKIRNKYIYRMTYWGNGKLKSRSKKVFEGDVLTKNSYQKFAIEGFTTKSIENDLIKKTTLIKQTSFMKNK